ncbi:unnamed protein product [Prunus armeniaca]|uniref:DUF7787 domain-containing protein n=1 Tax=Prunus armeniaca TaxID=36596 RepID=A0A6J5UA04_PRUAR|nr:hypothetical protein GBA52_010309 [Prunus armeniaca]CAB4273201.1 unnamed protein product [Prunus armeniaca]
MAMVSVSKAKTRGPNHKMSLEDYLLLIQSHSNLHLTASDLNQILSMHGHRKIHGGNKQRLSDAVSSMSLVQPARTTLKDGISPFAITAQEDVIDALDVLKWKECCVTSIETLSSSKHAHCSPLTSPCSDVAKHKKHQQSAPLPLNSVAYGVISALDGASLSSGASETTHPAKESVQERKRKRSPSCGGGANSTASACVSYEAC